MAQAHSSCTLSCLCALLHVGALCSDPGTCLVSGSVLVSCWGSDTHILGLVLLRERAVSSLLGPCAPLSVCIVFVSTWFGFACFFIFSLFAFACFVLFCVGHSLCFSLAACFHVCHVVNTQLMSLLISCVFMSRFAHVSDSVLLAMCLCFCFVWLLL